MLDVLDISATGLTVQRHRMTGIANNIANAETTRAGVDKNGEAIPYRRRATLQRQRGGVFGRQLQGVMGKYIQDPRPFKEVYDPGHPDAIKQGPKAGYVRMPNVDITVEYVNALNAQRGYEANVQVMNVSKTMMNSAIRILA